MPGLHPVTRLTLFIRPPQTGFAASRVYPVGMAHVVIADADYGVLYLLAILIARLGWTSDMAASGAEAWVKVQRHMADRMTSMTGYPGCGGLSG